MHEHSEDIIRSIEKTFTHTDRFASFDFCYNFFHTYKGKLCGENIEKSCMELWSYLASWGMLRGSSALLQKSPASLAGIIKCIDEEIDKRIWEIDLPNYSEANIEILNKTYKKIAKELKEIKVSATKTLVTKIMLGVFGSVPAFDTNFCSWARDEYKEDENVTNKFRGFNKESLKIVYSFYRVNKVTFDGIKKEFIDFNGEGIGRLYPIARLVDMYGFAKGELIVTQRRKEAIKRKNYNNKR